MLEPNVLLIKPSSSVFLKSEKTRAYFNKKLRENIKCALNRNNIKFERLEQARIRLYLYAKELEKCVPILQKIFGLHSIALSYKFHFSDLDEIAKQAVDFFLGRFDKADTFAVECSRTGMHYFSSQEVERKVGASIVREFGLKVDLKNPNKLLKIEIQNDLAYVYLDEVKCFGGLPTGVEGNVALFFSGEDTELASAWLMLRKGCNVFPVVEEKTKKVDEAIKLLIPWNCYRKFALTEINELEKLIKEREILALVKADTDVSKKAFKSYAELDSRYKLAVLRPLLFYPEDKLKELIRILKSGTSDFN